MNVLVIGGTRYFGKVIVRKLLARGDDVTILSRGNARPDFWSDVNHILSDRSQHIEFTAKLRDREFDAVIDNVAFTVEDAKAAVAALQGRTGKYLVASTVSVYGGIGHALQWQTNDKHGQSRHLHEFVNLNACCPLREDDLDLSEVNWDFDPNVNEYAQSKRQIERYLWETSSFPSVVLRVPITVGPEEHALRFWWYMQRILDEREIVLRDGGTNAFRLGFRDDISQAFIDAMDSPNTTNQIYNVCQDEVVTLRRFLEVMAEKLGRKANVVSIPGDAAETLSGLPWEDWRFDAFSRPHQYLMSIEKAKRDFRLHNTPMAEWVQQTIEWHEGHHDGRDSAFYDRRNEEVHFAQKWRQHYGQLIENLKHQHGNE